MIIQNRIDIGDLDQFSWTACWNIPSSSNRSTSWLIVSSFDPNYLDFNEHSVKYLPCVGMAVRLDNNNDDDENSSTLGQAYCFLPLSIETGLKYHVNGTFALSDDRARLSTRSREDKQNSTTSDPDWNVYLLSPLVANLISLIQILIARQKRHNLTARGLVELAWPITTKPYFDMFAAKFYQTICQSDHSVFPTIDAEWVNFERSCFVDFKLENSSSIHDLALKCLDRIYKQTKPEIRVVELPSVNMEAIRTHLTDRQQKRVSYLDFVGLVLANKQAIDSSDYETLLVMFLSDDKPAIANMLRCNESIPTRSGRFRSPKHLVDPESNRTFRELFDDSDDVFPSERLCCLGQAMVVLNDLGMVKTKLPDELCVDRARKIEELWSNNKQAETRARQLSLSLVTYLKENERGKKKLIAKLHEIKWLFAKSKPAKRELSWCVECEHMISDQIFRPIDLYDDQHELLIGCVKPLFSHEFSFILVKRFALLIFFCSI